MPDRDIANAKAAVRARIWELLDRNQAVVDGSAHGRIPNFIGADQAANNLAALPQWQAAQVIKAVPDKAQLPARAGALRDSKTVYMAVPKLADPEPFYLLDPAQLPAPAEQAAASNIAATVAPHISLDNMKPIDLIICGSVAVNHHGARLGKGAGYSDIEVALLHEAGLITPNTVIATTVHDLQIVEDDLPETDHDFRIDLIVTPSRTITCHTPRHRTKLTWDHLTPEQVAAIPVLAARAASAQR